MLSATHNNSSIGKAVECYLTREHRAPGAGLTREAHKLLPSTSNARLRQKQPMWEAQSLSYSFALEQTEQLRKNSQQLMLERSPSGCVFTSLGPAVKSSEYCKHLLFFLLKPRTGRAAFPALCEHRTPSVQHFLSGPMEFYISNITNHRTVRVGRDL